MLPATRGRSDGVACTEQTVVPVGDLWRFFELAFWGLLEREEWRKSARVATSGIAVDKRKAPCCLARLKGEATGSSSLRPLTLLP